MKINCFFLILGVVLFNSCSTDVLPKPKAQLRLEYVEPTYQKVLTGCPFTIETSQESIIEFESNCWARISYPSLNASIHLTYRPVQQNLSTVLQELEKLTYEHAVKADAINAQPYENAFKKVYGKIINVEGDVASNLQFHATDSLNNVLFGALYFNVKPNYDSLLPAINYIEKDVRNLMESIEWKP